MIQLDGKKIAILGFGKEGQATFEYLKKTGVKVAAVLDQAAALTLEKESLLKQSQVSYIGGPNYLDSLPEYDVIVRSPGVPRMHPKLMTLKNQDAIYSHTKLFFDLCPCPIIAVTGTKGKTTTASLIYEILKSAGRDVRLGGNIGEPPLNFVTDLTADSLVVLEVSSFQSQDLHASPHIGVILNVTHDHLDDGTFRAASHVSNEEYLAAKAQLIANQKPADVAILHPALGEVFLNSGQGRKIIFHPEEFADWQTKLLGRHNLENIAAAATACTQLDITEDQIKKAVAEFYGVPQRLQLVAEKNGIRYVNDSASTNPDSSIAAIGAFREGVILIAGGSEKFLDYAEFGHVIANSPQVKALVAIGAVAPKIIQAAIGFKGQILTDAKNMKEIVEQANSAAASGDTVLLSPAAASFGMFENSKDRGQQFDREVKAL